MIDGRYTSLLDDLYSLGITFDQLFKPLHQCVGDGHAREFGIVTTVCSRLRVTTANVISD